ncbi:hypothetical protein KC19_5G126700 [Ceratodon purpureus]|uniref:J domain-containing protein n=1 Tax=Ceratodon purpureus TaxID=3225 RepID=A0A8T0I1Y6_CERPU|nr:hypothetical protein KC19_5G126700 [Ceratodon purpureus]
MQGLLRRLFVRKFESASMDSGGLDALWQELHLRETTSTDSTSTSGESQGGDKKHVDTRIHWGNSMDGWIGIEDSDGNPAQSSSWGRSTRNNASILDQASDSHYTYLGVSSNAELEEIKSAYRRLSKLYHPDSTQLPLEIAAQKFMRLKVSLPFQTWFSTYTT